MIEKGEKVMNTATFEELLGSEHTDDFIESARPFTKLMMQYKCAMLEIQTKFEVLNTELSLDGDRNPIQSVCCRLKQPVSIIEKLKRKGQVVCVENIEKYIHDVAGIRVICAFPEDIYLLADKICAQDDIRLIEKKDYIRFPKQNGYRSLHLILEVPVFFADEKKKMQVEVQFRTIAMDFWASIEHKVRYKKEGNPFTPQIEEALKSCAEGIHKIDLKMQQISKQANFQTLKNDFMEKTGV